MEEKCFEIENSKNENYVGEDGLLHCGICKEPIEAYFPEKVREIFCKDRHPTLCACKKKRLEAEEQRQREQNHKYTVERLKTNCFPYKAFVDSTFENSMFENKQMTYCQNYVKHWEEMKQQNIGLLFWGDVGIGKTYLAACIANALMEQEVSVKMINFSYVLNTGFEEKNRLIDSLNDYGLLIIDDFGSERGTEYGLETIHSVLDARFNSKKPMIVTTNLSLKMLQNPEDEMHKKIYDRLKHCIPVQFTGESIRKQEGKIKMEEFKRILLQDRESL